MMAEDNFLIAASWFGNAKEEVIKEQNYERSHFYDGLINLCQGLSEIRDLLSEIKEKLDTK